MRRPIPRKAISKSFVEIRSYQGGNDPRNRYIMIKGYVRKSEFFNVFLAHELKGACIDILGLKDSKQVRQGTNANEFAKKVWYKE